MRLRKITGLVLLLAACICVFSACSSKFVCGLCHEEKSGKQYEATVLGKKMTICEKCHATMNVLEDGMSNGLNPFLGGGSD